MFVTSCAKLLGEQMCVFQNDMYCWKEYISITYIYIYIDVCIYIYIYHVGANFSKKPGEQNVCFLMICIVERQYIYI